MIEWDESKNQYLKSERNLSFEQVIGEIESDRVIEILPNPNHAGQIIFIVSINDYTCACPAVPTETGYFLKTVYKSRKFHKRFRGDSL